MSKVRNTTPEGTQKARDLRKSMGVSETKLWDLLRNRRRQFKFRRQHPVGPYVLDFYCPVAKLCIEVDGEMHAQRIEQDLKRDAFLRELGIETMRVGSWAVLDDPDVVIERILDECQAKRM